MKHAIVLTAAVSLFLSTLAGCGKETDRPRRPVDSRPAVSQPADSPAPAPAAPPATRPEPAPAPAKASPVAPALSPAQAWGLAVFACYQAAIRETVAALEGEPPAQQAIPRLQAVKDKAVAALVPLGRQREAMDASARAQADSALIQKMMSLEKDPVYLKYHALATGPYLGGLAKTGAPKEAAALVADMNIITQYASFDLLKKQAPQEARRLGIP